MKIKTPGKESTRVTTPELPLSAQIREEIQQLAHQFYCQCGCEHGHDLEHWLEAERRVLEQYRGRLNRRG